MTLMIYASVSQEVSVLPLCILLVAVIDNLSSEQRVLTGRWALLLVVALIISVSARPPYGGLILSSSIPVFVSYGTSATASDAV